MNLIKVNKNQLLPILRVSLGSVLMMVFIGLIGGFSFTATDFRTLMSHTLYLSLFILGFIILILVTSRRAYLYYLLFSCSVLCLILVIWEIAFVYGGKRFSLSFTLALTIIILGLYLWYQYRRKRIRQARRLNIASGRLNLKQAEWDFQKEFHLEDSQGQMVDLKLWWKAGRWIAPFGPPIGYFLSRNLNESELFDVFSVLFLIISTFMAWAGLSCLVLIWDLREIEREIGIKILIPAAEQ